MSAQTVYEDVILLKTSEVLRGKITDSIPRESVTILLRDSVSRKVLYADVERILKEPKRIGKSEIESRQTSKDMQGNNPVHYQGIISGGYGVTLSENGLDFFKVNMIHGIGFGGMASFGLGVGLRLLSTQEVSAVPVFLDVRFAVLSGAVSPVFAVGVGNTFQNEDKWQNSGGIFYGEVGVRFRKQYKGGVMITLGYESFEVILPREGRYNLFNPNSQRRPDGQINAWSLNLGFTF
jgi:hypothetical protein